MKDLLFAAIDLTGRSCTVIGGGSVAERKIKKLVKCGAAVTAVAPDFTYSLDELGREEIISVKRRCYQTGDLADTFLAVIATDDDVANKNALNEAKQLGILVNAAFDKAHGDLYFTATRDVGDFVISAMNKEMSPKQSLELLNDIEAGLKRVK